MKRFMKVLLGLSIGAAVGMLLARKSGRELREQLIGGGTGKLLPAAPVEFPEPEGERLWDAGTATAVAEPAVVEEAVVVEETVVEEAVVVEETVVEEPIAEEAAVVEEAVAVDDAGVVEEVVVVEEVAAAEPEIAEEATSEDLRARIEETRAAVETDIAQPFGSVAAEDVVEEAAAEEAVVEELAAEESAEDEVAAEEAEVEDATAEEAVIEEPVLEGPEFHEPSAPPEPEVAVEAPAEEPRAWETAYEADDAGPAEESLAEEPVAEEPVYEAPAADEPVAEQAPVREAAEGLVADITSGPVAVVAEEAPVDEPVVEEESVAREDGTIDQAEMRRRIEETRARLKAKAFDAMMSGESALLSRDSGEKPVPKGDDVELDGELETTIDESLSQEEY